MFFLMLLWRWGSCHRGNCQESLDDARGRKLAFRRDRAENQEPDHERLQRERQAQPPESFRPRVFAGNREKCIARGASPRNACVLIQIRWRRPPVYEVQREEFPSRHNVPLVTKTDRTRELTVGAGYRPVTRPPSVETVERGRRRGSRARYRSRRQNRFPDKTAGRRRREPRRATAVSTGRASNPRFRRRAE